MDRLRRQGLRFEEGFRGDEVSPPCLIDGGMEPMPLPAYRPWHGNLARVVEREIIPRLMLVHGSGPARPEPAARKPTEAEIALFSALLLAPAGQDAESRIGAMVDEGLSLESLLMDLLVPSARHLGELWEEDACDFTELTIAMGRLQRILHDISLRFGDGDGPVPEGRRILLGPCPGETHLFGLSVLERFFRDAGWIVTGTALEPSSDLAASAAAAWFDVIGLSLNCEVLLPVLGEAVRAVRDASLNRDVRILVGGSIFVGNPGYVALVGADATAPDAHRAVVTAESLLDLRALAC